MDANGLRFWLLGDGAHFPARRHTVWDANCRRLRLASERTLQPVLSQADAHATAQSALERVPREIDAIDCVARWDAATSSVLVHGPLPGDSTLLSLADTPSDLCTGPDGVLYVALPSGVRLHDLRARWADVTVSLAGFTPWRVAPAADGGVWVMERGSGRLARVTGRPVRTQTPQPDDYDPRVFRPEPENACAPALRLVASPAWGASETPQALAAGPDGALAVLSWLDGDGTAGVRRWLPEQQRLDAALQLQGAAYAYALAWLAPSRIALRVPGRRDAPAFELDAAEFGIVAALGEVYPLSADAQEASFANGSVQPPHYPVGDAQAEPLVPLSLNQLARRGEADNFADSASGLVARLIDSGNTTTVWHRLVAEAVLPAHTGFVAWLAATNEPAPPPSDDLSAWHPHGFGRDIGSLDDAMLGPQVPRAVWESAASELPHHPGLLDRPREPQRSGLFSVLVQNTRQRARTLVGRYLWVRLTLHGDGRVGPEIAALRVWGSRFSYADRYLPRLYRESMFGDAAAAPGDRIAQIEATHAGALNAGGPPSATVRARLAVEAIALNDAATIVVEAPGRLWLLRDGARAWRLRNEPDSSGVAGVTVIGVYQPRATPADFNARLLANFEGVLTLMEDRVAAAHLLSHPAVVADAQLDWLGSWIGVAFDAALPAERRRDWLRAAPDLARRHGTRDGLRLALDVATSGAVRSGEIVVIEDFRLRRILATLLGVDLADEQDPLLPGLQHSGNSIVGDTLFVGDQERIELMALFDAAQSTAAENAAAVAFDAQLAHRATVLVHREVEPQDFGLIRRIVRAEAPAHVDVRVVAASWPLLVGIASLVGVDTYLGPPRPPRPVQVQRSSLGNGDFLIGAVSLDPRLAGVSAPPSLPPVADAGPDRTVRSTESFVLDGSGSTAAPGRHLTEYRWRWLPPDGV